jgi:MoaA/NifB/PqqE/SkfB family radical SAM enzyme
MCNVWKNPSLPEEEISLETLDKIPAGQNTINLTGGEPTLRADLMEIVDLLYFKTDKLEISSNGLFPHKLEPIIKKYPDIKIRFSLDGFDETNNLIRGENDGFEKKTKGLLHLQELGGTDLGFAITIQDDNAADLVGIFHYAEKYGFELSTSTLHNGFQFYKKDNFPYDRARIARHIEELITEQIKTNKVKNWFRAYLGLGLIAKVLGNSRLLPCNVGYDSIFVDPWGDAYACNVRPDLYMGNLNRQTWDEIFHSPLSDEVRSKVSQCQQNCWMVGSAKSAMRQSKSSRLPRWVPFIWVIMNKFRVSLGLKIDFKRYVNYSVSAEFEPGLHRMFYLNQPGERRVQRKGDEHYADGVEYFNR